MAKATLMIDRSAIVARVDRRLFGAFVEHLGRCVYDGIYEPGHPAADGDGFRRDVVELVSELGTTTIRYPGGNFVSGYRWQDGVGPRDQRPVRRDLAWHSLETNQVGLDEFARWAKLTGSEIMMAVNLGTQGVLDALDLLEYANHPSGTQLSDQRARNGTTEPYGIRMWCLGNEMDGPWQIGAMSADDYGSLAARTAAAMRMAQSDLELVVCGSSSSSMPTFGHWERVVLEHTYEHVDYISCHAYYQERAGDLGSFLASSLDMEYFISTVSTVADEVKLAKNSSKTMKLSFDEWNIWYLDEHRESHEVSETEWPIAPRLLEDVYSVADAVVLGNLLITLLKHHDRVASASLAQLVNVIAPIMTEPGGPAWRQTTFFPFSTTSRMAKGSVIRPVITCDRYETALYGMADVVDAVATLADDGVASVFLVNRSVSEPATIVIDVRGLGVSRVSEAHLLHDDDPYAKNTLAEQDRVGLRPLHDVVLDDGTLTLTLPPVSWAAIGLAR
ncbi:alpha-L-arabinofuranosidase [Salinibacterium hongtaonis]|uniref:non-reducing end alpha-L-arabinofuranosidase n=2 Tax=Homoserinimonas hongtaonis TaxID=2079791 RepID=A0A2U1T3N7_9MICO|nr:alpha-L-arabinofuranosidase C-terminal domain-containing protein [Salinibacterium hongtaonis]PWB98467.1 alpha-L-arabinofuranosidase [Salinibacterium hongtaonis]